VHRVAPLRNSPTLGERRRHSRHKPNSIIYVALGPGNGGILVNLSAGGVSLQAAAKLNAEAELALNFRLQGIEQAIETLGCVTWLDPTQKEAGISFKDLPGNAEQQIAEWIASQEQPAWNIQTETKPHPMPTARGEPIRPPIQASIPVIFPSEKPESAHSSFAPGILHESLSESPQQDDFANALDAMPPPAPVSPTLPFPTRPEERFESPSNKPLELPAKRYELRLEPQSPLVGGREFLPRDCLLPDSISARREVVAADRPAPATPDSSALDLRRRRKFAIAAAAGMMGILVLMVMATRPSAPPVPDGTGEQAVQSISPPATVLPESAPQTRAGAQTEGTVGTAPSVTASTGVDPAARVPVVRIGVPVQQYGGFMGRLRALLGVDAANTIDPATAALPVWTIQHSGFYYCTDSPDFRTLQRGAIMTQGQALQSGYQPKLGSYCE
jgi:PilZ domain